MPGRGFPKTATLDASAARIAADRSVVAVSHRFTVSGRGVASPPVFRKLPRPPTIGRVGTLFFRLTDERHLELNRAPT
jgi:hypothetical protein